MKIKDIIEMVDREKVNAFSPESKVRLISELDGKIALDVMLMDTSEVRQFCYSYPEDLEKEPLVSFPHDDLYRYWLGAMIDAENGEANRYQNSMVLYNTALDNFKDWYTSNYVLCGCQDKVTAYITAYGLAVKQGFVGDVDAWLQSLVGPQGPQGVPGAKIRIGSVVTVDTAAEAFAEIVGTVDDPVLNLGIPLATDSVLVKTGGTMQGDIKMGGNAITGLKAPASPEDAATKNYVDTTALPRTGGKMQGDLDMDGKSLTGMKAPASPKDAATKNYVDTAALLRTGGMMQGDLDMGGKSLKGLKAPELGSDAVTLDTLKAGGLLHRGSSAEVDLEAAAPQGVYAISEENPVCDIADGLVIAIGNVLQLVISGDGSKVCLRTKGEGGWNPRRFLSFGYGSQLPETGLEGELFFLEDQE